MNNPKITSTFKLVFGTVVGLTMLCPYTAGELIQRRILKYPPDKWKDIAQDLNVRYGTVTSDWERYCKPLLEQIRQQFGYEVE